MSWTRSDCLKGTVILVLIALAAAPLIVAAVVLNTVCELTAAVLSAVWSLVAPASASQAFEREAPTLIFPGTCTWVFWQIGATQYLCERYDLSRVRIIGVSSGAVCAAFILVLEPCRSPAAVRQRAVELFESLMVVMAPIVTHPAAFISRLGDIMERLLTQFIPAGVVPGNRIQLGMRRAALWPVPHLRAVVATSFGSKEDFIAAVAASSTVFGVVHYWPVRKYRGGLCSDGVNPYSLFGAVDFCWQRVVGRSAVTAPECTWNDSLVPVHAMWNIGAMSSLLPTRSRSPVFWVSPSIGGHIQLRYLLLLSASWARQLWCDGYREARRLDGAGYFAGLAPIRVARGADPKRDAASTAPQPDESL